MSKRLADHIDRLAAKHGITLEFGSNSGVAYPRKRLVKLRPVKSTVTYAIALHEMGHLVGRGRSAPRLQCEANAWSWALRNALPGTVDATFEKQVRNSLRSYFRWACVRSEQIVPLVIVDEGVDYQLPPPYFWTEPLPGCPAIPPEGHDFWRLLNLGAACPDGVVQWPT